MPGPKELLAIRNHIAANPAAFRKILAHRQIASLGGLQGDQLVRVPKGFAPDHPAADLLRYKQFLVWVSHPPEMALGNGSVASACSNLSHAAAAGAFSECTAQACEEGHDGVEIIHEEHEGARSVKLFGEGGRRKRDRMMNGLSSNDEGMTDAKWLSLP